MKSSNTSTTNSLLLLLSLVASLISDSSAFVSRLKTTSSSSLFAATSSSAKTNYETLGDVNMAKMYAQSTFPIKPEELIALAKEAIFMKRIGTADGGACLANGFQFRAAFVEVNKAEYLKALETFDLANSFDITQQFFGWTVDPTQPNRVWVIGRTNAVHSKGSFMGVPADNKKLMMPPETLHIDFTPEGKIVEFGFYTVDRAQGNTGGLGGAFGYFFGVGRPLPFPECKPYEMTWQRKLYTKIAPLLQKLAPKPE